MIHRDALADYLDETLAVGSFSDACPNGLQVEGKSTISRLIVGVTASQALLDRAVDLGADAVVVHHGYFWKGESQAIVGIKQKRIKALLTHDISLFAYHLPLDAHRIFGNNARLCQVLNATVVGAFGPQDIGLIAHLPTPESLPSFCRRLEAVVGRTLFVAGETRKAISTIAICSGAAQSLYFDAVAKGVDCFISGEISEHNASEAVETGVPYLAAGHHATERFGIAALGEHLASEFDLTADFIDIDTRL